MIGARAPLKAEAEARRPAGAVSSARMLPVVVAASLPAVVSLLVAEAAASLLLVEAAVSLPAAEDRRPT